MTTVENSTVVFKKLKLELPYDPEVPLQCTEPLQMKTGSQRGISTCTKLVFIAALFIRAKS
jgi:hypothetical protein